ncbi:MFS transporter [Methylocystis rosea]|uniref:MFS transporter n=1 Tax=Methylocystis rosea TaxID=173366 RepID=A0A3G8MCS5_9HYPH|nr:MFS transporter [Methylocystis rosea]AZG78932.1 MFS transporter [Methylocystis rosea]
MIVSFDRLVGGKLLLLLGALGIGYVDVLSNVSGHSVLTPYSAGSLEGVTPSFAAWGTTFYLIGVALGVPFARVLSGRFGEYRVLTFGYFCYAIASLICVSSESVFMYAPTRFVFGVFGGFLAVVSQSAALGELPEKQYKIGLGYWAALGILPYTLAVFLGGFWAEYFSWRWLFYANATLGVLISAIIGALLYGREYKRKIVRFDAVGYVLLVITLIAMQMMLSLGNDFDWFGSPLLSLALFTVIFSLPLFIIWEWGERHPIVDVRLFSRSSYAIGVLSGFLGFFVIQGLMSLLSVQLQLLLGYTSSLAGHVYLAMMVAGLPLAGFMYEISKKLDVRFVICMMCMCSSVVLTWLGLFDKNASYDTLTIPVVFLGFCVAALSAPTSTLATYGLSGPAYKRAAEEFLLFRLVGGAFGIAFQSVIYFRRTPWHQLNLSEYLGGRRFASLDTLAALTQQLQSLGVSESVTRRVIARAIRQQAGILAMDDAFLLGAVIMFLLGVVVWFAKLQKHPAKPAGASAPPPGQTMAAEH